MVLITLFDVVTLLTRICYLFFARYRVIQGVKAISYFSEHTTRHKCINDSSLDFLLSAPKNKQDLE